MATMKINYSITFLSDWHIGSGLGSGAEADSTVIKDKNDLPFLPGKTVKGLLRDALMDIAEVQKEEISKIYIDFIETYFGKEVKDENEKVIRTESGKLYFSSATLPQSEAKEITKELSSFLYRIHASTRLENTGIAAQSSLRTMEVCVPLTLVGTIEGEDVEEKKVKEKLELAFKYLRHVGANRNRGLGRCEWKSL